MTNFEEKIYKKLKHNAAVFLSEGVTKLIDKNGAWTDVIDEDSLIVACGMIQTSLELALKAHLIKESGFATIVDISKSGTTEREWDQAFKDNKIWIKEFDRLLGAYRKTGDSYFSTKISPHDAKEYPTIEHFQNYRNKIFHFAANIEPESLASEKRKLLAYAIRVVMYLLFDRYKDQTPDMYFEELLGWDFYDKLSKCPDFGPAMQKMASASCKNPWYCPICGWKTFDHELSYCYCCQFSIEPTFLHTTDCPSCATKNSLVYDYNAPYIQYPNVYSGYCMACDSHHEVFECPTCGRSRIFYIGENTKCCSCEGDQSEL